MNCTIVHVSKYDFVPEGSTDRLTGVKITYLEAAQHSPNIKGRPVVTVSGPVELWSKMADIPGVYDVDLRLKMKSFGSVSKPVATVADVEYLGEDADS